MVTVKSAAELALMRKANEIVADALNLLEENVKPGVSTKQLDKIAHDYIVRAGAVPSFLGYGGFPGSICASINDEVIHGIPRANRILQEGDIISIDIGSVYKGFNGDAARTIGVGEIGKEAQSIIDVTKESFFSGIAVLRDGVRLGDLGYAIESYAESRGYSVVRQYVGHGIGRAMHEDPSVPNYGTPVRGMRLKSGMTLAIEPMINEGTYEVKVLDDDWTVVTADGRLSAHYENTVAITDDGVEILSLKG